MLFDIHDLKSFSHFWFFNLKIFYSCSIPLKLTPHAREDKNLQTRDMKRVFPPLDVFFRWLSGTDGIFMFNDNRRYRHTLIHTHRVPSETKKNFIHAASDAAAVVLNVNGFLSESLATNDGGVSCVWIMDVNISRSMCGCYWNQNQNQPLCSVAIKANVRQNETIKAIIY